MEGVDGWWVGGGGVAGGVRDDGVWTRDRRDGMVVVGVRACCKHGRAKWSSTIAKYGGRQVTSRVRRAEMKSRWVVSATVMARSVCMLLPGFRTDSEARAPTGVCPYGG